MKHFYKELQAVLLSPQAVTMFNTAGVPEVKQIDLYRGQYLFQEEFEQLLLPAVLLEYNINHVDNVATINLHCCWEQLYETDNKTVAQDNGLKFFDWQDVLYQIINRMESTNTGKLKLTSEAVQQDDTPTLVHVFSYECSYMGRVVKTADRYNEGTGEEVTTEGTIQPQPPKEPEPEAASNPYNFK